MNFNSGQNFWSIQYLRGLAATLVVFHHTSEIFQMHTGFGMIGVDIFFVISGFIMLFITSEKKNNPLIFIKKRFLRVVPLYWIITIILFAAVSLKPNLFPMETAEYGHFLKSLFFIPHTSPSGTLFPLLVQGWTLNYEMFFYILFAATLVCKTKTQLSLLFTIMVSLVLIGAVMNFETPAGVTYTSPLLLEFLSGMVICLLVFKNLILPKKTAILTILASIAAVLMDEIMAPNLPRIVSFGIPSALIVYAVLSLECNGHIKKHNILKIIGDASYSIYLTHSLSYVAMAIILTKLTGDVPIITMPLIIAGGIVGGVATYFIIEKPLMTLFKKL